MADPNKKAGPDTPSGDYRAMAPYWAKVSTILKGADAMRAAGETYLPKFPKETKKNYEYRRKNAQFTNIFRDIVENLAAKPFSKTCLLNDDTASEDLKALAEDIDGAGNNLHVFAGEVMFNGVAKGLDYIFVDSTKIPQGLSVADEKKLGARPYWVRIRAEDVVCAYSAMINGKEQFTHVRVLESETVQDGFNERVVERVRVYNRVKMPDGKYAAPTWEVFEKQRVDNSADWTWTSIEKGLFTIGVIPLVPFLTGRREGRSWRFDPPMRDAADVQIKHYQQETNLHSVKELTCFPTLCGNGINPPIDPKTGNPVEIAIGPGQTLFAPGGAEGKSASWTLLEPTTASLQFLSNDLRETGKELRELGRQPLTAQSGNLTVVTTAFAAQKGNSAAQAWALALKDALEQAFRFTQLWLRDTQSDPAVYVYADFQAELQDAQSMDRVIKMRENTDISRRTLWTEAQRRGDLSDDFDPEAEEKALRDEGDDPAEGDDMLAAVVPTPLRAAA